MSRLSWTRARRFAAARREWLVLGVGAVILVIAFGALHALLSEVRVSDVARGLRTVGFDRIGVAVLFTAGSFAALSLYDVLALRTIGHRLPYRLVGWTSFSSYAVANMLGVSILTGGSVRMRLYVPAGVSPENVARVVALASMTFWAGVFVLFGVVLLLQPGALHFSGWGAGTRLQLPIGLAIVGAFAAYLVYASARPRTLRVGKVSVALPGPATAVAQALAAAFDLACGAAVLFVLIPGLGIADYPMLLTAYVVALVAGVMAHTPGGIGVFEAVFLLALPEIDRASLVTGLVMYRVVYFVLPFAIAAGGLAITEGARLHARAAPSQRPPSPAGSTAPLVMAVLVFAAGALLLVSGMYPPAGGRMALLARWLPPAAIDGAHLLAGATATLLMLVAAGLHRRQRRGFEVASALLVVGAALALARGLDYPEALVLAGVLVLLGWDRAALLPGGRPMPEPVPLRWLSGVFVVLVVAAFTAHFSYKHVPLEPALLWHSSPGGDPARALRALIAAGATVAAAALFRIALPSSAAPFRSRSSGRDPAGV